MMTMSTMKISSFVYINGLEYLYFISLVFTMNDYDTK